MPTMTISADFFNYTKPTSRRVSFQFSMAGTKQSGVSYVTADVEPGTDIMIAAAKAAKIVAKRSGADEVKLRNIVPPVR
jgi:hypothetical protein